MRPSFVFVLAFAALVVMTVQIHYLYPLSYGQDFHYHLMSAAMGARSTADPVRELYRAINPLDANTLLYTIAYPFERVSTPVRAFQIACTIGYYVGYPVGCAYALLRTGRSPWGALLAFPLAYGLTSIAGGYWPFLCATSFIAPALAEMHVMQNQRGAKARRAGIACAALCALTFLAHATVFAWLSCLLAIYTLLMMARACGLDALSQPRAAARRMFMVGGPSLLMITPALLLFARWYWAMMFGSNKPDRPFPYAPPAEPPMGDKLLKIIDYLAPTRGEHEYWYLGALWVVCAIALVAGNRERARARSELPVFELAFILTLAAYVAFPFWLQYESTSPRLFDLAVLAFPLVLFPKAPRLRSRAALAVALVFVFCVARVRYVGEQLRVLNEVDYGGFVATANTCARVVPHERVNKLAYANGLQDVKSFKAAAAHQLYETFAAQCGLEAPVYDTHVNYNHLLALRYAGAMPAPRTMIGTDHWYDHPKLWDDFEYVLVREWNPSRRDDAALAPRARLVARYGGYQLWERK